MNRKIVVTGDAGYHILCLLEKIDNRVKAQAAASVQKPKDTAA
jgi:hypothetical protein